MAKFELYFKDFFFNNKASINKNLIDEINVIEMCFYDKNTELESSFFMDKSTAIKFAKTLRTEINKITESEVNNG